ncbi:NIPSNAP family protein [Paraburkholderia sp.]|uniref:NIPSNAP family protein n=1 Tax=Paraburkholderia sp. TaxID=1926495 RepID=UPI0039E3A457
MIVEERIYDLRPNSAAEFARHFEREGIAIQRPILGRLVGYFYTEIGPLNQVVHLWAYEDLEDRAKRRAVLAANPVWRDYVKQNIQPLLVRMQNKILVPMSFSPPLPPLWQAGDATEQQR